MDECKIAEYMLGGKQTTSSQSRSCKWAKEVRSTCSTSSM